MAGAGVWAEGEVWLGREDSNLRLPDPESGALPLGNAPMSDPSAGRNDAPLLLGEDSIGRLRQEVARGWIQSG